MDRCLIGNVDEYQQYADVPHEPFIASGKLIYYIQNNIKVCMYLLPILNFKREAEE